LYSLLLRYETMFLFCSYQSSKRPTNMPDPDLKNIWRDGQRNCSYM